MNEQGVEALVNAQMQGVKQAFGAFISGNGARCAAQVLRDAACRAWTFPLIEGVYELRASVECPECGWVMGEGQMICHLNDDHRYDFIKIARTLGEVPA